MGNGTDGTTGATAVLLFGLANRSLRHVIGDLESRLLTPLREAGRVDLFFHSWNPGVIRNPRSGETAGADDEDSVYRLLPGIRGVFEPQDRFDGATDWEPFFERNPMRHCTDTEEAARITLMNVRRALASLERVWRFFESARTRAYDRVVVTRPDLRFLQNLELPEALWSAIGPEDAGAKRCLWAPRFHAWGGINDRFVIGREREAGVWCRRADFADRQLLSGHEINSEQILGRWLEKNHIRIEFLDFVFQRVRATGDVAELDRDLKPTPSPTVIQRAVTATGMTPVKQERFLILAREPSPASERLKRILKPLGKVEVVLDRVGSDDADPAHVLIPEEEAGAFGGMMSDSGPFPWVTAWSRALCHLSRTRRIDEAVWFVEDDVAGNPTSFKALKEATRRVEVDLAAINIQTHRENRGWPYWRYAAGFFTEPARSYQPLCRLSPRLVDAVLALQAERGRCTFHEVMFASVALGEGMRCLSWYREPGFRDLFGEFRYRPEVRSVQHGICHPVKDPDVHEAISTLLSWTRTSENEGGGSPEGSRESLRHGTRFEVESCPDGKLPEVVNPGPERPGCQGDALPAHPGRIPAYRDSNLQARQPSMNLQELILFLERVLESDSDYLWFVDDRVDFQGGEETFLDDFEVCDADLIATFVRTRSEDPDWPWWDTLAGPDDGFTEAEVAAMLPLVRLSGRAAKYCRNALREGWDGHPEVLLPTLVKRAGLMIEDVGDSGRFTPAERVDKWYEPRTWRREGPVEQIDGRIHFPVPEVDDGLDSRRLRRITKASLPRMLFASPVGAGCGPLLYQTLECFRSAGADCLLFQYEEGDLDVSALAEVVPDRGFKWQLARRHLGPGVVGNYDFVFYWDDDLDVSGFDPVRFARIMSMNRLSMAQPAIRSDHGLSHPITARQPVQPAWRISGSEDLLPVVGRLTNFVEIMAPAFTAGAWSEFHAYLSEDNRSGWGYDYIPLERKGIIDVLPIVHTRPVASIGQDSEDDLRKFLDRNGLFRHAAVEQGWLFEPSARPGGGGDQRT